MKKKLLFLPIVVAAMLLTGCESLNLSSIIPQPSSASESAPESSVDELSSGENLSSKDPEFDLSEYLVHFNSLYESVFIALLLYPYKKLVA